MSQTITLTANDGTTVQYVDDGKPMQGGLKDVYFSPDRSYVVAFFREKFALAEYKAQKDRLTTICGQYRESIFNRDGGQYWTDLYCWPSRVVEHQGLLGVVTPVYRPEFFFKFGYNPAAASLASIVGKEKEGKWFAVPQFRSERFKFHLDHRELGDWFKYLRICLRISQAVRRLHAAGLAHSDLSYKNVLIDPVTGNAAIIDIDGLVVPGRFPPDVIGTPDFIAPEVMATKHRDKKDPARILPGIATDRHALAVMIYMYLLYRHPLRGGKVNDLDPDEDEHLSMGEKALFVEHPTDRSNRPRLDQVNPNHLPWADVDKIPYTACGPYLKALFDRAFIDGLHNPALRPSAHDWEDALVRTIALLQPCQNPDCDQQWFVLDNTATQPDCPFCGTHFRGQLPVLHYHSRKAGAFRPDEQCLAVYHNQHLYPWHTNANLAPNEKLSEEQKKPVGYFVHHGGDWMLVNQGLPSLQELIAGDRIPIPVGRSVVLSEGKEILLSEEEGGRLVKVQLAGNPEDIGLAYKPQPRSRDRKPPAPAPPNPAAPAAHNAVIHAFSVSPTRIRQGERAELSWEVSGVSEIAITGLGTTRMLKYRITVDPAATTSYTIEAGGLRQQVQVVVDPPASAPGGHAVIHQFSVTPTHIRPGESAELSWEVSGVNEVYVTGVGLTKMLKSRMKVNPTATMLYVLDAGSLQQQVQLTVQPQSAAPAGNRRTWTMMVAGVLAFLNSLIVLGQSSRPNGSSLDGVFYLLSVGALITGGVGLFRSRVWGWQLLVGTFFTFIAISIFCYPTYQGVTHFAPGLYRAVKEMAASGIWPLVFLLVPKTTRALGIGRQDYKLPGTVAVIVGCLVAMFIIYQ